MKILFEPEAVGKAPGLEIILFEAEIDNQPTSQELWAEIEQQEKILAESYKMEQIRHRQAIDGTRKAYKAMGKDPNRYRPSAEALCRRAVKGMDLYRTLTVIDLINLLSLKTGHSIGGFDADKIVGDSLTFGVGRKDEPYEAIGRGELNIEGLPVLRDAVGGVGTPTSDNDRTKLSPQTKRLVMTVNMYAPSEISSQEVVAEVIRLLEKYASAINITYTIYSAQQ